MDAFPDFRAHWPMVHRLSQPVRPTCRTANPLFRRLPPGPPTPHSIATSIPTVVQSTSQAISRPSKSDLSKTHLLQSGSSEWGSRQRHLPMIPPRPPPPVPVTQVSSADRHDRFQRADFLLQSPARSCSPPKRVFSPTRSDGELSVGHDDVRLSPDPISRRIDRERS